VQHVTAPQQLVQGAAGRRAAAKRCRTCMVAGKLRRTCTLPAYSRVVVDNDRRAVSAAQRSTTNYGVE